MVQLCTSRQPSSQESPPRDGEAQALGVAEEETNEPGLAAGPSAEGRMVQGRYAYELGAMIGKGNDGQVVRAVNLETGKRLAIKIIKRAQNQIQEDILSEGDYMKRVQS